MVFEIVLNNKFPFFFKNLIYIFYKEKIYVCVHYWKNFKFKLESCHFVKIVIKYQSSKMMFYVMFEIK